MLPNGQLIDLYDDTLFANIPVETDLLFMARQTTVLVVVKENVVEPENNPDVLLGIYSLREIKVKSRLFDPPRRRLNKFERKMNEKARALCFDDGRLFLNPIKRLEMARGRRTPNNRRRRVLPRIAPV